LPDCHCNVLKHIATFWVDCGANETMKRLDRIKPDFITRFELNFAVIQPQKTTGID
jgi:hypothetical protein